jgi:hypothetical protein
MFVLIAYSKTNGRVRSVHTAPASFSPNDIDALGLSPDTGHTILEADMLTELFPEGRVVDYKLQFGALAYQGPGLPENQIPLEEARQQKLDEIERRSNEIADQGFLFQGMRFGMGLSGQTKILGLDAMRNDPFLTYPVEYNNIDETAVLYLDTPDEVHAFALTAFGEYRRVFDQGTMLKSRVRAATTLEELSGIYDPR